VSARHRLTTVVPASSIPRRQGCGRRGARRAGAPRNRVLSRARRRAVPPLLNPLAERGEEDENWPRHGRRRVARDTTFGAGGGDRPGSAAAVTNRASRPLAVRRSTQLYRLSRKSPASYRGPPKASTGIAGERWRTVVVGIHRQPSRRLRPPSRDRVPRPRRARGGSPSSRGTGFPTARSGGVPVEKSFRRRGALSFSSGRRRSGVRNEPPPRRLRFPAPDVSFEGANRWGQVISLYPAARWARHPRGGRRSSELQEWGACFGKLGEGGSPKWGQTVRPTRPTSAFGPRHRTAVASKIGRGYKIVEAASLAEGLRERGRLCPVVVFTRRWKPSRCTKPSRYCSATPVRHPLDRNAHLHGDWPPAAKLAAGPLATSQSPLFPERTLELETCATENLRRHLSRERGEPL